LRRDILLELLESAGFRCFRPKGAYYVMTDIAGFGFADDLAFARHLLAQVGVIGVPGSSFYADRRGRKPADALLLLQEGRDSSGGCGERLAKVAKKMISVERV